MAYVLESELYRLRKEANPMSCKYCLLSLPLRAAARAHLAVGRAAAAATNDIGADALKTINIFFYPFRDAPP